MTDLQGRRHATGAAGTRRRSAGTSPTHRHSAVTLGAWLVEHRHLLRGLAALRRLGPVADDAVAGAMSLPEIRRIVPSWELWRALAASDGIDPDALLAQEAPLDLVELACRALWDRTTPP